MLHGEHRDIMQKSTAIKHKHKYYYYIFTCGSISQTPTMFPDAMYVYQLVPYKNTIFILYILFCWQYVDISTNKFYFVDNMSIFQPIYIFYFVDDVSILILMILNDYVYFCICIFANSCFKCRATFLFKQKSGFWVGVSRGCIIARADLGSYSWGQLLRARRIKHKKYTYEVLDGSISKDFKNTSFTVCAQLHNPAMINALTKRTVRVICKCPCMFVFNFFNEQLFLVSSTYERSHWNSLSYCGFCVCC